MNISNKLTFARIAAVPVFLFFMLCETIPHHWLWAGLVFGAASITDILDGHFARKYGLVTSLGKFLDPLADKILVLAAMVPMIKFGLASPVAVIIIIAREYAVNGMRFIAASSDGNVIAANVWGKIKTGLQMTTVVAAFVAKELPVMFKGLGYAAGHLNTAVYIMFWITAVFTAVSGVAYIWQNRRYLSE